MEINREIALSLLSMVGAKPTKDLGQNFLVDVSIANKLVQMCDIDANDKVLEIGPGLGSLTHFIKDKTNKLTCVDIDHNMISILKDIYKDSDIEFVEQNSLNMRYGFIISYIFYF